MNIKRKYSINLKKCLSIFFLFLKIFNAFPIENSNANVSESGSTCNSIELKTDVSRKRRLSSEEDESERNPKISCHCPNFNLDSNVKLIQQEEQPAEWEHVIRDIKSNFPLTEAIIRGLGPVINLTTLNRSPILYLDGSELEPSKWEHEICFLEFIYMPNYLTEVHFINFPFNSLISTYIYRLLLRNSERIRVLIISNCFVASDCNFLWNLSSFENLSTFSLSKTEMKRDNFCFLINNLPNSLKSLSISENSLHSKTKKNMKIKFDHLELLETLIFNNFSLTSSSLKKLLVRSVLNLKNLQFVDLANCNIGEYLLRELKFHSPNWTFLSLENTQIYDSNLISHSGLLNLCNLKSLNISNNYVSPRSIIDGLQRNSVLECINMKQLEGELVDVNFSDKLKIILDYFMPLTFHNWRNLLSQLARVEFDFISDFSIIKEIVQNQNNKILFENVTKLIISNILTENNFNLLSGLFMKFPNLESVSIKIDFIQDIATETIFFSHKFVSVQSVKLDIFNISNSIVCEDSIAKILHCFPSVKKVILRCSPKFEFNAIKFIKTFELLHTQFKELKQLELRCRLNLRHAMHFFSWVSKLPKLHTLLLCFNRNSNLNRVIAVSVFSVKLRNLELKFENLSDIEPELNAIFSFLTIKHHLKMSGVTSSTMNVLKNNPKSISRLRKLDLEGNIDKTSSTILVKLLADLTFLRSLKTAFWEISEEENEKYKQLFNCLPFLSRSEYYHPVH